MKFSLFALLAATAAAAARETVQEATLHARQLVRNESILTLTSIVAEEVNTLLAGQPFALDHCWIWLT
jgi:hypothetical protein